MNFEFSDKVKNLQQRLRDFMEKHIYPNETEIQAQIDGGESRWVPIPLMDDLKNEAKAAGLWNLFLPESEYGAGLTNLEYAPLAEIMGRSLYASEVFNCSPPDTGNMEVLVRYGTPEQKDRWLKPLLTGDIRSAFSMTEPEVASSDATNIRTDIRGEEDCYIRYAHSHHLPVSFPLVAFSLFQRRTACFLGVLRWSPNISRERSAGPALSSPAFPPRPQPLGWSTEWGSFASLGTS